jgi:hypothetical protein
MGTRKRARSRAEGAPARRRERPAFRAIIAEGLYELRVDARVVLDLLVTPDGELCTFVRVDGALLAELPIAGKA